MSNRKSFEGNAVRRSEGQGRALVEQWRRSGATISEFCRQQSVGAHVLRYWLAREGRPSQSAGTRGDFFVVSTPEPVRDSERVVPVSKAQDPQRAAGGAVIVVLPVATAGLLMRTVRGLWQEVGR